MSTNDLGAQIWSDSTFRVRRTVDLLCREFEEHWRDGRKLSIEEFLKKSDTSLQDDLLPELVAAEWELRLVANESPERDDYAARFPQLGALLTKLESTDYFEPEISHPLALSQTMPEPGEEFTGYRILKELGRGAMGSVFLAEVPVIGHRVALKVLRPDLQESLPAVARFEREAKLLSKLDHPGLVPLYSYGESNGLRYLVMKAINGVSLATAIAGKDGIESEDSVVGTIRSLGAVGRSELLMSIACQLVDALKAVHAAEVLHRDIKPSNILLTDTGQVFLTDFSLAKVESPGFDITRSDEFVGTLRYCAPESLDGVYSKQGDIYSLGLVLFELFSLATPFESSSRRELLTRKMSGVVPELANHSSSIPEPMLVVLRRMMQYDPAARYQSADEVVEALGFCRQHTSQPGSIRHRTTMLAVASILLLVVVASIWSIISARRDAASDASVSRTNPASADDKPVLISTGSVAATDVGATNVVAMTESSPRMYAQGHEAARSTASAADEWLIPGRYFELPNNIPASHISISNDGTHLVVVSAKVRVFMGTINAERLPIFAEPLQSRIAAIDQSENGDFVVLVHQDFGRPLSRTEASGASDPEYFVETFDQQRQTWNRIPGPLFRFAGGMPYFIPGPSHHNRCELLVPEASTPVIYDPPVGGYLAVNWPRASSTAISCFFFYGAAAIQDGRVVLFPLFHENRERGADTSQIVATPITDCRTLQHSLDGQFVVAVGQREACIVSTKEAKLLATLDVSNFQKPKLSFSNDSRWLVFSDADHVQCFDLAAMEWHGEPLCFDDKLLLVTPLLDSVLTVEESGRVQETSLIPAVSKVIHEFESAGLTAATFSLLARRLVIATKDGSVRILHMP